jgi:hypothetical protein
VTQYSHIWGTEAADSIAADLAVPMIATRDIADVASQALKARNWQGGGVRELLGQRDLSSSEATRIGKPDLQYVQFSYADEAQAAGAGEHVRELRRNSYPRFMTRVRKGCWSAKTESLKTCSRLRRLRCSCSVMPIASAPNMQRRCYACSHMLNSRKMSPRCCFPIKGVARMRSA